MEEMLDLGGRGDCLGRRKCMDVYALSGWKELVYFVLYLYECSLALFGREAFLDIHV
jgi:hypothetical protein